MPITSRDKMLSNLIAENERMRKREAMLFGTMGITTLVACVACNRGTRNRDTTNGRCPICERDRLRMRVAATEATIAELFAANAELIEELGRKDEEPGE
jgi:hypothetical protein